jgi:glutamine synthetase
MRPVFICPDPSIENGYLVMTEVLNADGTPHVSNGRATIDDKDDDFWFGFEQEYFLMDTATKLPVGFPAGGHPAVGQGPYYCGVGGNLVFGREFKDRHLDLCIAAGLNVEGTNGEVATGQWEWQIFAKGAQQAGDEVWIARYLMERLSEEYGLYIEYHPKPLGQTDWNGSGMHANFSNTYTRTAASKEKIEKVCEAFRSVVPEHIAVYGAYNDQRLTGKHETASIHDFSYGVSDRGASIRIPLYTKNKGWSGYLEDRRPASNADPYKVAARIIKTVKTVK